MMTHERYVDDPLDDYVFEAGPAVSTCSAS